MTTFSFKPVIDIPVWRPLAPSPNASGAGYCWASDLRNTTWNHPYNYVLVGSTTFLAYNPLNDEYLPLASPALAGTFGGGAAAVFNPSQGPRGVLAGGNTTQSVVLSTVLPASVTQNQLSNRGDGLGFVIRIIGNGVGGSGRTESRRIVANTGGTAPTIVLDSPLTFTPVVGDSYEIRSGRVYLLGAGTTAAGIWKWYDVATNSFSGNLATANLPGTIGTDSCLVPLSEAFVPSDRPDSTSGFFGNLTSVVGNTTTTIGTASGVLPTNLDNNEYRNFQIRIVEDLTNTTAVGQRRRIASHTSGATPTWTLTSAWTTVPSSAARFVIENDDDKVLLFTNQTAVYTYNITANTWDTTTFAAAANAGGAGICASQAFGFVKDPTGIARHSSIFRVRGGGSAAVDVLDISSGATGSWSTDITYGYRSQTFTTGTCAVYDPVTNGGRYLYLNVNGGQRFARLDLFSRVLEPWTFLGIPGAAAVVGGKLGMSYFYDGSTKLGFLSFQHNTGASVFSIACHR